MFPYFSPSYWGFGQLTLPSITPLKSQGSVKLCYSSDNDEEVFQSHSHGSKSGVKFKYNTYYKLKEKVFELFPQNYFKSMHIKLFMLE